MFLHPEVNPVDQQDWNLASSRATPVAEAYYRILEVGPGWSARLQLGILKRAAWGLRAVASPRLYLMIWFVSKAFRRANHVRVRLRNQCDLRIGLGDPYWMYRVLSQLPYEPELLWLFDAVAQAHRAPTLLVDCGANVGWCSLVAALKHRFHSIAVEPAPHLVRQMEWNRQLNQASFQIVQKAIWKEDGRQLPFLTDLSDHAGGHLKAVAGITPEWRVPMKELVTSVTVDTLVDDWRRGRACGDDLLVVIKLDVEGAESEAMAGCAKTLGGHAILVYEDHGSDLTCEATRAALSHGLAIYALMESGGLLAIESIDSAVSIKKDEKQGYNFVAARKYAKGEELLKRIQTHVQRIS